MSTQNRSKMHSRSPKLHLMYFVDASETRSISVSISALKFATIMIIGMAIFSLACNAVLVFTVRHLLFVQSEIRQLKAAHIAQSVVHENLLREGPFIVATGSSELLNITTKKVAAALINKKPMTPQDASDELLGLHNSSSLFETARGSKTETATSAEDTKSSQLFPTVKEQKQESAFGGQAPIELSEFKMEHKSEDNKLIVSFTLKNVQQFGTIITGNICAIVTALDGGGKKVHLPYPTEFNDQPDGPLHCESGLKVSFARYKPTQLVIESPPLKWTALNVYFSDADGTTEQTIEISK